jgi:pyridinium-3,5-biscarboxylic acid mononucleotide sulfurtransferase
MSDASARARLDAVLAGFDRLAVAVSGGVDSMTLAWVAHRRLGPSALTVFHAVSPAVPSAATARVLKYAREACWSVNVIDAGELADERYLANPVDRCFFCKADLYGAVRRRTADPIASGANLDDLGDYRPGLRAADEHGVRHPLVEAGIDKAAVRALAAAEDLHDLADLPASPCLSSRIETGIRITPAALALVEAAEGLLRDAFPGAATLRARLRRHGIELQLDPATLEGLSGPARADLAARVGVLAAERGMGGAGVTIAAYARGSAFLHGRRAP